MNEKELKTGCCGDNLGDSEPVFTSFSLEATYSIEITERFILNLPGIYPNWFHRKMMTLFFGWKFKKL